jgi:hypothetical protein
MLNEIDAFVLGGYESLIHSVLTISISVMKMTEDGDQFKKP